MDFLSIIHILEWEVYKDFDPTQVGNTLTLPKRERALPAGVEVRRVFWQLTSLIKLLGGLWVEHGWGFHNN
jgi:hypothetical protein